MPARKLPSLIMRTSHFFSGRYQPGSSIYRSQKTSARGKPLSQTRSRTRLMNPFICAPPVTASRAPASLAPETELCFCACVSRVPQNSFTAALNRASIFGSRVKDPDSYLLILMVVLLNSDDVSFETRLHPDSK